MGGDMKNFLLGVFIVPLFVATPLRASDETFYCYSEITALLDTKKGMDTGFNDPTTDKENHHYDISLNLTKKQIGYEDHFGDKDVWLDADVTREGQKWIFASPLIEFPESAPEKTIVYFNRETLSFTEVSQRFPEDPNFFELFGVQSGYCEKKNEP